MKGEGAAREARPEASGEGAEAGEGPGATGGGRRSKKREQKRYKTQYNPLILSRKEALYLRGNFALRKEGLDLWRNLARPGGEGGAHRGRGERHTGPPKAAEEKKQ